MNIIKIDKLTKKFQGTTVLNQISLNLKSGTFAALLGRNGSGKSTLLNILMGNEKFELGTCLLFGRDIKTDPFELKNSIGHVSEKIEFNYPIPVDDFLKSYGKLFKEFDYDFINTSAKDLKISLKKQFGGYSRGQKMQIVLLAAMAQKPKLLLIDEITSVLDAFARKYIMDLLKSFTIKGGTVLITTNIVSEVEGLCDEVIFLEDAKIKFHQKVKDLPAGKTLEHLYIQHSLGKSAHE